MRKHARLTLSRHLFSITGMGIDDLPNTAEINEVVDELEDMLFDDASKESIAEYLRETITPQNIYKFI